MFLFIFKQELLHLLVYTLTNYRNENVPPSSVSSIRLCLLGGCVDGPYTLF